jgi:protein-L-isoaspartate O-methyltransferase
LQTEAVAHCDRWLDHIENRLAYERAMLDDAGGMATDRNKPEKGGACRCWASHRGAWSWIVKVNRVSVTVLDNWGNAGQLDGAHNFTRNIPFDKLAKVMSAAEVNAAREAGRLHELPDKTGFMLSADQPAEPTTTGEAQAAAIVADHREAFDKMRESLAAGVQVVTAPQLFPTPPALAARMAELAEVRPDDRVLEPSAGIGNLIAAVWGNYRGTFAAVEINPQLANELRRRFPAIVVDCCDFLTCNGDLGAFDRILMNPPFANGADIKHIMHARHMLKPGGRLVAICADGPRQREQLQPIATHWEDLPAGTFAEQGTNVNTALLVIQN